MPGIATTMRDVGDMDGNAQGTLVLLETRLQRLEFLLTGAASDDLPTESQDLPIHGKATIQTKLENLEADLDRLKRLDGLAGDVIRSVERLRTNYPDLFASAASGQNPKSEDLSTLASIVLSHASLYPETASRLSSLQTLQIPSAEQSSSLIDLKPRLETCQRIEDELEAEIRDLRERSARCLEWWVTIGVVGMGDLWEEWERRVAEVEKNLIWFERRRKEEQGYL